MKEKLNSSTSITNSTLKCEEQTEVGDQWDLSEVWTPGTLQRQARQVGSQFTRIAEQNRQLEMAQRNETTAIEKMMELMMQMKQEEQVMETRREQERLERENRKGREEREREERREREDRERGNTGTKTNAVIDTTYRGTTGSSPTGDDKSA